MFLIPSIEPKDYVMLKKLCPNLPDSYNPRARLRKDVHAIIPDATSVPDIKKGSHK